MNDIYIDYKHLFKNVQPNVPKKGKNTEVERDWDHPQKMPVVSGFVGRKGDVQEAE